MKSRSGNTGALNRRRRKLSGDPRSPWNCPLARWKETSRLPRDINQLALCLAPPPEQGVTPICTDYRSHQDELDRYREAPRAPEGHSKLLGVQEAEDPLHLQLWGRPHRTLHWVPTPRAGMREPGGARGDCPAYCAVPAAE